MSTPARQLANQANAQLSTGPKTEEGKAIASRNALTTALTGQTVLLPTDDTSCYDRHLAAYHQRFRPANLAETTLVQLIADTDWRLLRIPTLLLALEACAQEELTTERADEYNKLDEATRTLRLTLDTYGRIEKRSRNLQLQESRLHRRREKDMAELKALQAERARREEHDLKIATDLYIAAQAENRPFNPLTFGFEISIDRIQANADCLHAATVAQQHLSPSRNIA